jgi:MerR family transcriptional regulator, light-induced transcriptional regulator
MDSTQIGNILLNIDQVSKLTGVKKSTIRYWEKSFDQFLKPVRTESNRREYSMDDIGRLKTIKKLVEQEHLTNLGVKLRLGQLVQEDTGN